jgi:hypothetical protein
MKQYYERVDLHGQEKERDLILSKGLLNIRLRPVTLPFPGWVSLEDRKPTEMDCCADGYGRLWTLISNKGNQHYVPLDCLFKYPEATHFLPIPKFEGKK